MMEKIKGIRRETWLLILLAGVLLLVISLPAEKEQEPEETKESARRESAEAAEYADQLEKQVEELLSTIDGAGRVEVMLTVESGGETVLQTDSSGEERTVRETDSQGGQGITTEKSASTQTVLSGNGDEPYVTKELCPKVTGAAVSADGGGDGTVKAEISEALEALFDLPPHKIKVLKRVEESEKGAVP